jgi:hypothetical protein
MVRRRSSRSRKWSNACCSFLNRPRLTAADALALALTYAQESRSPIARVSRKL